MERDFPTLGVLSQGLERASAPLLLLGEQVYGAVQSDGQDVLIGRDGLVGLALAHIGTIAADSSGDLFTFMEAETAGKGEQSQGPWQVNLLWREVARQGRAFRLLALFLSLSKLHIEAVGALAQRNLQSCFGILAQDLWLATQLALVPLGNSQGARVAAVGIVGAADKAARLADAKAKRS